MAQESTVKPARKPKLGQNFLAEPGTARKIVEALGDQGEQLVIEIGPGRGALTKLLADRCPRLALIELDRLLAAHLRMEYARHPNVHVLEGDVLAMDFATIVGGALQGTRAFTPGTAPPVARIIGNLPYYITSDILLRLFHFHRYFERLVVMVQKEVADRLAAQPGTRDYGLLTATAQLYGRVERLFVVPPGAFSPPPKVYSAVVRITIAPRCEELGVQAAPFTDFLKLAFAQKRKTLFNNLRERYEDAPVRAALAAAKVRADVRAEALPLDELAAIYKTLIS